MEPAPAAPAALPAEAVEIADEGRSALAELLQRVDALALAESSGEDTAAGAASVRLALERAEQCGAALPAALAAAKAEPAASAAQLQRRAELREGVAAKRAKVKGLLDLLYELEGDSVGLLEAAAPPPQAEGAA